MRQQIQTEVSIQPIVPVERYTLKIYTDSYVELEHVISGDFPHIFINNLDLGNSEFEELFRSTYEDATSECDHMDMLKKKYRPSSIKGKRGFVCLPIYKYEHGDIQYSLSDVCRFDSAVIGACIFREKERERLLQDLSNISQLVNGEVYQFNLHDHITDEEDNCGGFLDLNGMKQYLPEFFKDKDLTDYIEW